MESAWSRGHPRPRDIPAFNRRQLAGRAQHAAEQEPGELCEKQNARQSGRVVKWIGARA